MFRRHITCVLAAMLSGLLPGSDTDLNKATGTGVGIEASLIAEANTFASDTPVVIRYLVTNNTDQPYRFLPWGTPLEARLTADLFEISFHGESLSYAGIMVKRAAPAESDFIELPAGKTLEAEVELSLSYDMRAAGEYTVQLKLYNGLYLLGDREVSLITAPLVLVRTAA